MNWRGPAQAVEHGLFDATRWTLPGLDILENFQRWIGAFRNLDTGAAWLSSARVVRCWLSRNRRNPFLICQRFAELYDTARQTGGRRGRRQVIMRNLRPGLHTCYKWSGTKGLALPSDGMLSQKADRSPDWSALDSWVGIASNRGSECHPVNTRSRSLVHTARHTMGSLLHQQPE